MLRLELATPRDGALRILCLGAHCDDIEIGCGATLLRLLEEHPGANVRWVVFASTPERAAETRRSAAAFLAGAADPSVEILEFRESYFPWVGDEIKDVFEAIKRGPAPDVVFTHAREDRHQDHRAISDLTWNTFRDHLVLEYEIPKYDGDLGRPNAFVPVSRAAAQRKVELVLEHYPSQAKRAWFQADTFWALLRLRGIECNAPEGLAEAFFGHKLVV